MIEARVAGVEQLQLRLLSPERLERALKAVQVARKSIDRALARRGAGYRDRLGAFEAEPELEIAWVEVQGTQPWAYEVSIEFVEVAGSRETAFATCTCPYSEDEFDCKHTWAALERLELALDAELTARRSSAVGRAKAQRVKEPGWQRGLRQLDQFLSEAGPPQADALADEGEVRMVWRVKLTRGAPTVAAYEQKLRRQGGYTKGRKVSLERLARTRGLWTRPDVRAVARLITEQESYRYYGRYRSVDYVLDHGKALLELVGSRHVTWHDRSEQPVTVRAGRLGLSLLPRGKTQLELVPTFGGQPLEALPKAAADSDSELLIVRSADTITVGRVEPAALALVACLDAKARVFPKKSHSELLERLERLEPALPVHVPDALRGAPVDGDGRLRLLLTPLQGGLSVAARVRPIEGGAAFAPGVDAGTLRAWAQGKRVDVRRDLDRERLQARALMVALGLAPAEGCEDDPQGWSWQLEGEDALDLLSAVQSVRSHDGEPGPILEWPEGERIWVSREVTPDHLRVTVRDRRDWFGLEGDVEVDGWTVPMAALLEGLQRGDRYVALDGGRWLKVSKLLRERLGALGDVVHRSGAQLEVDATAGPVVQELLDDAGEVEVCEGWSELQARLKKARRVSTNPPRALKAELREYQRDGFAWLKRLSTWGVGACLADDMGLGKTVQAIALLISRTKQGPALVVAPTSVGFNWRREVERFAPRLRPLLYRETDRASVLETLQGRDVVIVSYDLARIDIEKLQAVAWGTLVFDEAQQVKNGATKTARALRRLSGDWRLALTGTPIENHLGDLWSLFRLISPGVFGSWEAFKARFAVPIERDGDAERRAALARVIQPFILRRTKDEVLPDLPRRTEVQLEVDLSKPERRLYAEARLAALAELAADDGQDKRFQILAALTKLRQLACHPKLVDASWSRGSAKLSAFLTVLEDLREGGHRALVFSQFTRHLALVREVLDAKGISYQYLDGSTPARRRQQRVDAFQAGEGELFLISLKAGGRGLNLTGADYVIHLDPWWNPAVEDQATDRAHRIGQTRPVTVYRLVARATIEEQILALHADKRDLVAGVLAGTNRVGKLSTDELLDLIRSGQGGAGGVPSREPPSNGTLGRGVPSRGTSGREARGASEASSSRLRRLRARLDLSQSEMGVLLGVSTATICRWERTPRAMPERRLAKLDEVSALTPTAARRRLAR